MIDFYFVWTIGSTGGFLGVKEIELFDSSTILFMDLEKLSRAGLEGSGAICDSLALNDEIVPWDKKVVSLHGGRSGTNFDKGRKSWSQSKKEGEGGSGPLRGVEGLPPAIQFWSTSAQ